ncbi:MAG: hypothetical protein WBA42_05635 [Mesorhizobium sp.]
MTHFSILHAVRRYVGKVRTLRNEIRTERFLNSLPSDIRADIGWPDMHDGWPKRGN